MVPKVSIGLPVYNGERLVGETLDSLLGQTFGDLEIVITDNASTDRTEAICRDYAARDPRVRYFRNGTNIGAVPNHNLVFTYATGTYFKYTGADDLHKPTYLEKCVAVLDRDPSVVLCHSRTMLIGGDGRPLTYNPETDRFTDGNPQVQIQRPAAIFAQSEDPVARFKDALLNIPMTNHIFGLMRREVVARTGLFGPYYTSDRAFLIEMALHGRFAEVPEELFLKREHPKNSRHMGSDEVKARWAGGKTLITRLYPKAQEWAWIFQSVMRSPLSPAEKARCVWFASTKAVANRLSRKAALKPS